MEYFASVSSGSPSPFASTFQVAVKVTLASGMIKFPVVACTSSLVQPANTWPVHVGSVVGRVFVVPLKMSVSFCGIFCAFVPAVPAA